MKHRVFLMLLLISIAFLGVAGPGKLSPPVVDDPPQYTQWSAPAQPRSDGKFKLR